MMTRFRLVSGAIALEGSVTDENPRTAGIIIESLPIEGRANRWGEEVYFDTALDIPEETGRQDVEVGEVAFWPAGRAIAIFFGRTPVSVSERPRAYENVNVFGRLEGEVKSLSRVEGGDVVLLESC
jgi:hypothetical protein